MRLERAIGWLDPFRVLTARERADFCAAYRQHLADQDGDVDVASRTLSRRERACAELASKPVSWTGDLDAEAFWRALADPRQEPADLRTLWLVALAKANEGESFGVEKELRRFQKRGSIGHVEPDLFLHIMLQEGYHSRLLQAACETCDLSVSTRPPRWALRVGLLVALMLPERARWTMVMSGEVVGATVFRRLASNSDLFSAEPEVEQRLREVLRQIWIDEVLHVAFLRAVLGPASLRFARGLLSSIARVATRDLPPLERLGCDADSVRQELRSGVAIPPELGWLVSDRGA